MKVHKKMASYIGVLLFSAFSSNIIAECGPCHEEQIHKGMLQSLPPLSAAIALGDKNKLNQLLSSGEDPNVINPLTGMSAMFELLNAKCDAQLLGTMIKHGAQVQQPDERGVWPVHSAATQASPDCLQVLVEAGASLEQPDSSGSTPLFYAVKYNSPQVVRYLRDQDVDVMHTNKRGMDIYKLALLYMVVYDYRETVDVVRDILEQKTQ